MRSDGRSPGQLRPVSIEPNFLKGPAGSALIRCGATWVLCTASVDERVPPFVRSGGWLTAEYGMLPGSGSERVSRGPSGRGKEIERLIGRSLRAALDLERLGARTVTIDCDVLQADGGTRTAAITGGYVALVLALRRLRERGLLSEDPLRGAVAAVSAGIVAGLPCVDLCYEEDVAAEVDMNLVMLRQGAGGPSPGASHQPGEARFVEIQGTGEHGTFDRAQLDALCELGAAGVADLLLAQARVLG